jgi:hypothetical protein
MKKLYFAPIIYSAATNLFYLLCLFAQGKTSKIHNVLPLIWFCAIAICALITPIFCGKYAKTVINHRQRLSVWPLYNAAVFSVPTLIIHLTSNILWAFIIFFIVFFYIFLWTLIIGLRYAHKRSMTCTYEKQFDNL